MENDIQFVYGIAEGSVHEGGGTHKTMYFDKEKAISIALTIIEAKNKELERLHVSEKEDCPDDPECWIFDRKLELSLDYGDNYWSDGYDYVCVFEYSVI